MMINFGMMSYSELRDSMEKHTANQIFQSPNYRNPVSFLWQGRTYYPVSNADTSWRDYVKQMWKTDDEMPMMKNGFHDIAYAVVSLMVKKDNKPTAYPAPRY